MASQLTIPASVPGRFGPYGGRYVPETLMVPLLELERVYEQAKSDATFQAKFNDLLKISLAVPRRFNSPNVSPNTSAARASTSNAKTFSTPARTKSTTPSARAF